MIKHYIMIIAITTAMIVIGHIVRMVTEAIEDHFEWPDGTVLTVIYVILAVIIILALEIIGKGVIF